MSTLIRGVKRLCVVYSSHPSVRTADKSTFSSFDSVLMTETTEKISSMPSSSRCYLMDEVAHNTTPQRGGASMKQFTKVFTSVAIVSFVQLTATVESLYTGLLYTGFRLYRSNSQFQN